MTGQRVEKILELVNKAAEAHKRRVSTAVINEVLEEALRWHSPPTTRQGRQGKIYYGTQVSTQPPRSLCLSMMLNALTITIDATLSDNSVNN